MMLKNEAAVIYGVRLFCHTEESEMVERTDTEV